MIYAMMKMIVLVAMMIVVSVMVVTQKIWDVVVMSQLQESVVVMIL